MVTPWLPDIIRDVVQAIEIPGIEIQFKHGIYSQVGQDLYHEGFTGNVLAWLVANIAVSRTDDGHFGSTSADLIFATKTDKGWSQEQRDDESFKDKLIPVYESFLVKLSRESRLVYLGKHTVVYRSYWGGGVPNGVGTENLFGKYIDAISINNLQFKIKNKACP